MVKNETEVDETIMKVVDNIDWHAVPQPEAASFGLSVGFFRDSNQICQLRRTALGTVLGGIISSTTLVILALLLGASAWFTLAVVVVHQVLRAAVLAFRSAQAKKQHREIQQQAIEIAQRLADRYPIRDAAAA